jgi:hypothetical protein
MDKADAFRTVWLFTTRLARIESGALPFSTQLIMAVIASFRSGPMPPPQCPMPGTIKQAKEVSSFGAIFRNGLFVVIHSHHGLKNRIGPA